MVMLLRPGRWSSTERWTTKSLVFDTTMASSRPASQFYSIANLAILLTAMPFVSTILWETRSGIFLASWCRSWHSINRARFSIIRKCILVLSLVDIQWFSIGSLAGNRFVFGMVLVMFHVRLLFSIRNNLSHLPFLFHPRTPGFISYTGGGLERAQERKSRYEWFKTGK